MFWKKKKPKRKQPVKKQIPKHIADNLKYGESVAEGLKKGVSEVSEKPNRKKPAGKNSEKHLDARKEFLRVFRQLTYRHRSWDVWSDFITMFACALSNPVDKNHFDEREKSYICGLSKDTTNRNSRCFPNSPHIRWWLWKKIKSRTFWEASTRNLALTAKNMSRFLHLTMFAS